MGIQSIVNTNMLFSKTSAATSKTKDRQENNISFKDVFKKISDNAEDVGNKNSVLPRKVVIGSRRSAIVSSQGQAQKDKTNFQEDRLLSQDFSDSTNSDFENRSEIQSLQAQMMEFLQLIFNLFQSGESLDRFNLEQLFQNSSIQGTDFLEFAVKRSVQIEHECRSVFKFKH